METTTLNVRVEKSVKQSAEAVAQSLGMTLSTAVNIFLRQMINHDGLPFEVVNPRFNAESVAAFNEAEDILAGRRQAKRFDSVEALFDDLEDADDEEDD